MRLTRLTVRLVGPDGGEVEREGTVVREDNHNVEMLLNDGTTYVCSKGAIIRRELFDVDREGRIRG